MILQALSQYYDRMLADPNVDIAPLGFEPKAIDLMACGICVKVPAEIKRGV